MTTATEYFDKTAKESKDTTISKTELAAGVTGATLGGGISGAVGAEAKNAQQDMMRRSLMGSDEIRKLKGKKPSGPRLSLKAGGLRGAAAGALLAGGALGATKYYLDKKNKKGDKK